MSETAKTPVKEFLLLLLPALLLLGLANGLFYHFFFLMEMDQAREREKLHVDTTHHLIEGELERITSDLLVLNSLEALQRFITAEDSASRAEISQEFSAFILHKKRYDQVRLIDRSGMERIRVNKTKAGPQVVPDVQLQDKSARYYFREALQIPPGGIYTSPLDLNVEHGAIEVPFKPVIRFAAPIFNRQHQLVAVIVTNYLGSYLLEKIQQTLADTAPLELLNNKGYWLKSLEPDQEWGFMFPQKKDMTFASRHPDIWPSIDNQASGQLETPQGLFTFTRIDPNFFGQGSREVESGYHWHLISHLSAEKLAAVRTGLVDRILVVDLLALLFILPGAFLYARLKQKDREKRVALQRSNRQLEQALAEIKTLRGTLPICAKCRSIRDDEGYWNSIERYLRQHTDTELTHGICPSCMEELYAGQNWYERLKNKKGKTQQLEDENPSG